MLILYDSRASYALFHVILQQCLLAPWQIIAAVVIKMIITQPDINSHLRSQDPALLSARESVMYRLDGFTVYSDP